MMDPWYEQQSELRSNGQAYVVITLIDKKGSVPQQIGAKALVTKRGLFAGTVGGGKVEAKAIQFAKELLEDPAHGPLKKRWNLKVDLGMSCGGAVEFFFEPWQPEKKWRVAVFGAGHVGLEITALLLRLDCQVFSIEPRLEWRNKLPDHRQLTKVEDCASPELFLDQLAPDTQVVIVTQGHATDLPILHRALAKRFAYIGVIGSLSKRQRLINQLQDCGLSQELCQEFYCPMGLPLGQNTPGEIAISVVGQLIWHRDRFYQQTVSKWRSRSATLLAPEIMAQNTGERHHGEG